MKYFFIAFAATLFFAKITFANDVYSSSNISNIVNGRYHSCFFENSELKCIGSNKHGQTSIPSLKNPTSLAAGPFGTCVIDENKVKCWGVFDDDQNLIPNFKNPKSLAVGDGHSCVIDENKVKCWGFNYDGRTEPPAFKNPKSVVIGDGSLCAIDDNGVKCWGSELKNYVPSDLKNPRSLAVGKTHACVIDDNGLKCWGVNYYGEVSIPVLQNPKMVAVGEYYTCVIDDNQMKCWGDDKLGKILVPVLRNPKMISANFERTCAIDEDGANCWGTDSAYLNDIIYAQKMEIYCLTFTQITKNEMASKIKEMENSSFTVENYLEHSVCTPKDFSPRLKVPMIFNVVDDPFKHEEKLTTFWKYYSIKRKQPELFTKAINVKNTQGYTLLDHIARYRHKPGQDYAEEVFNRLTALLCEHGGVYSAFPLSCDSSESSSIFSQTKVKALAGNLAAQKKLILVYEHGLLGQSKDIDQQRYWTTLAAEQDDHESIIDMVWTYRSGELKNGALEIKWLSKLAKIEKDYEYYAQIGNIYHKGSVDISHDFEQAMYYWKKAMAFGYLQAQVDIAYAYIDLRDFASAIDWFNKCNSSYRAKCSIDGTHTSRTLGLLYVLGGNGIRSDFAKAANYYVKGKDYRDSYVWYEMLLHLKNSGTLGNQSPKDLFKTAISEWEKLARKGNKDAIFLIDLWNKFGKNEW